MIDRIHSKQMRRLIQQIIMPSGQCQACLSDKSLDKDFMITCTLCQSSIHMKHYGAAMVTYDRWKCQRCRMLLQLEHQNKLSQAGKMKCQFCPGTRGILKRVIYNGSETIWLHPQCSTWPYPIIYQKNSKRIHYNCEYPNRPTGCFWVDLQNQKQSPCQLCGNAQGYKIKCMYYTCQKYYHCSCAKAIGFIRDLESMRFENCDTYIPPYCQEHLEQRVNDCSAKARKYRNSGDQGKASSFTQLMGAYQVQLKNMRKSAQKYKNQEEIRKQMEYQTGDKDDILDQLSFEEEESHASHHRQDFLDYIFDKDYPPSKSGIKKHSFFFTKRPIQDLVIKQERMEQVRKQKEEQMQQESVQGQKVIGFCNNRGQIPDPNQSEQQSESEWVSEFNDERMSDQE